MEISQSQSYRVDTPLLAWTERPCTRNWTSEKELFSAKTSIPTEKSAEIFSDPSLT